MLTSALYVKHRLEATAVRKVLPALLGGVVESSTVAEKGCLNRHKPTFTHQFDDFPACFFFQDPRLRRHTASLLPGNGNVKIGLKLFAEILVDLPAREIPHKRVSGQQKQRRVHVYVFQTSCQQK